MVQLLIKSAEDKWLVDNSVQTTENVYIPQILDQEIILNSVTTSTTTTEPIKHFVDLIRQEYFSNYFTTTTTEDEFSPKKIASISGKMSRHFIPRGHIGKQD